jgi:hypothetical protein
MALGFSLYLDRWRGFAAAVACRDHASSHTMASGLPRRLGGYGQDSELRSLMRAGVVSNARWQPRAVIA